MQKKGRRVFKAFIALLIIIAMTSNDFLIMGKAVYATASKVKIQIEAVNEENSTKNTTNTESNSLMNEIVDSDEVSEEKKENLDKQTGDTLSKNVKFDTVFMKEDGNKTHYLNYDINGENPNMYMNISVKDGYLKNAYVEFKGRNYTFEALIDDDQIWQENKDEKMYLKPIEQDSSVVAKLGVKLGEEMKLSNLSKQSSVTLHATYVNNKGKEIQIEKEIKLEIGFTQNMELELAQNINSYFGFQVEGQNKVLVKMDATIKSKQESNNLPLKDLIVMAKVPVLNGISPESATIIPKNTIMTNGQKEENVIYSEEQIDYNKESGIVAIKINNQEKDGKIKNANGQDEYIVTYIYPQEAINTTEPPVLESIMGANATLYTKDEEKQINTVSEYQVLLTGEVGKAITLETIAKTENINKGKMYANAQMKEKEYKTEYESEWKIDITAKDVPDGIRVEERTEYFKDANGNNFMTSDLFDSYTHYKQTKINKSNFDNILGENGLVIIYNQSGEIIAQINKDSIVDSDGNYIVEYPEETKKHTESVTQESQPTNTTGEISLEDALAVVATQQQEEQIAQENGEEYVEGIDKIIIETSKPVAEGTLYINNSKEIEEWLPYTKEQIRTFTNLEQTLTLAQLNNNDMMILEEKPLTYNFEETTTNANIVLSKTNLSTLVINQDIEMKIELDNNREGSDLYENPIFLVELPEYIDDITIKESNILFDENLQIQSIEKFRENNKLYLRIILQGKQEGFSTGRFTNGTNIVLMTDITTNLLTPSIEDKINLYYLNPNAISYANNTLLGAQALGGSTEDISYTTPVGMVAVSSIDNGDKKVISVGQGTMTDKIGIYEKAQDKTMQVSLVNNTGNVCENIVAMGRIPFKGNKNIINNAELGTTMDTKLKTLLTPIGVDPNVVSIYYSENGEATQDLANTENGWTLSPQNLATVKSYLIVLNNYQMAPGEAMSFSYNFEIPANLEYGNSFYGTFETSFINNTSVGAIQEVASADAVGLTTGEGPKPSVTQLADNIPSDLTVRSGSIVSVKVNVSNKGTSDLENVVLREYIPKYTKYTKYQEVTGNFEGTKTEYVYPATKIEEGTNKEYIDIEVGKVEPNEIKTIVIDLKIQDVPKNILEYYESTEGFEQDEETGKYYIRTYDETTGDIKTSQEITQVPTIELNNETALYAKDLEKPLVNSETLAIIKPAYFQINETSNRDEKLLLTEGEDLSYDIDIDNISSEEMKNVKISKTLPTSLEYKEAYTLKYDEAKDDWVKDTKATYNESDRTVNFSIDSINDDTTIRVKVTTKVANLPEKTYEKDITTRTVVSADNVDKHYSNYITHTVAKPYLTAKMESDVKNGYIAEGDKVTYTVTIENKGKQSATNVEFNDTLPNELKFVEGNYIASKVNKFQAINANGQEVIFSKTIEPEEVVTVKIIAQAKNLPNSKNEITTSNYATLKGKNTETILSNSAKIRIEQSAILPNPKETDNSTNTDTNNNKTNTGTGGNTGTTGNSANASKLFSIRGTAWIDANSNGTRDNGEKLLEGIEVLLSDATSGELVVDKNTNEEKKTKTSKDGTYSFENLQAGNYIVIFFYDNQVYSLSDYRKSGVADSLNSDVISSKVTINGQQRVAGVTDTIKLKTSSYANVDIGLVNKNQFDLRLDKFLTKVGVQNKEGVKTYNYYDVALGKVDITAKQMAGSTIVAEYTIKVINEGNMPGYAKNVVDYMPKEMKFNSTLNPDWYAGKDGNLYNTSLGKQVINPGETKEIKLILTKKIADASSSIIHNSAEIAEDHNDLGVADLDSKPKNQAQGEDDLGSADLIISVKTGSAVTYTCIVLIVLIALAGTIYIIRKRKLDAKDYE